MAAGEFDIEKLAVAKFHGESSDGASGEKVVDSGERVSGGVELCGK
jgi:hypothetical protein